MYPNHLYVPAGNKVNYQENWTFLEIHLKKKILFFSGTSIISYKVTGYSLPALLIGKYALAILSYDNELVQMT